MSRRTVSKEIGFFAIVKLASSCSTFVGIISLVVYISTIDRDQITTSQSVSRLDNKRYAQTAIFELCHGGMIVCENETETSVAGQVWSGLR